MRTLLTVVLLSSLAFAQGIGGKAGVGGSAGFGGGVGGVGTTVTFDSLSCPVAGGAATETCTLASNPANGTAVVGAVFLYGTSATLTSVGDGTGAGGATGSSTYTIESVQTNSTNFVSYLFFTCNYVGTNGGVLSVNQSGTGGMYGIALVATGNTTTGTNCNDGYNFLVTTSAGTSCQTPTITTTNAHDMLAGFSLITSGYGTYTVGTDGQGNTFTSQNATSGVAVGQTINETATHAYYSAGSWTTASVNNCYVFAVK